jgi:flagellar hook-associated protein 3 FlgL
MTISRVTNFAMLNHTLGDVTDVQKQLATLQQQISSGLKSQDFKGLNGQVEQYTQLTARIANATGYQNGNQNGIARLQTADHAMDQMTSIADDMENLIVQARGPDKAGLDVAQQMKAFLESFAGQLNMNFEGKFLFGGTNTATPPVPDPMVAPNQPGVPDDSYYAGSKDDITYHSDERETYNFPVRADDPAFQKIFAAAKQAMRAAQNGSDGDMKSALDLMQQGQGELNSSRAGLNTTILNVQGTNDRLKSMQLYWQGVSDSIANTDLVAASTQVANFQAVLQASFQVYAQLSQLRLADYLR